MNVFKYLSPVHNTPKGSLSNRLAIWAKDQGIDVLYEPLVGKQEAFDQKNKELDKETKALEGEISKVRPSYFTDSMARLRGVAAGMDYASSAQQNYLVANLIKEISGRQNYSLLKD